MANSAVVQIIHDGPGGAVVKLSLALDTSNLAETVVADPATLMIDRGYSVTPNKLFIRRLQFSVQSPLAVRLQWKATANTEAFVCVNAEDLDFRDVGPIRNDALAAGNTGQLVAVTTGWTAGTMVASVLMWLGKGN